MLRAPRAASTKIGKQEYNEPPDPIHQKENEMHQVLRTAMLVAATVAMVAVLPHAPAEAGPNGKDLITKSDCLGCHAMAKGEAKKMGPNYADVAAKYAGKKGAADMLAGIIRKGGSGHWGSMPMPPHPQMSAADAKAIANYILAMNKGAKPAAKPAKGKTVKHKK